MKIIAILAVLAMLGGCAISKVKFDEQGNVSEIEGEAAILAFMSAQAVRDAKDAAATCQPANIDEVANLSEAGEVEYARAMEKCYLALLIAAGRGSPMTPQGEVAKAGSDAIVAAEQSEANVVRSAMGAFGIVGGAYIVGDAIKSVAANAKGDTYNVNGVQQSNSVNGSGVGGGVPGAEGEIAAAPGATSNANGTRANSIHIGPGNSSLGVVDQSPSAVLQPNVGQPDKPQAVDATGDFDNNDADEVQTSLF